MINRLIVLSICERETMLLGEVFDLESAQKLMKTNFMKIFKDDGRTEEEFDNEVGKDDEWGFDTYSAWLNDACSGRNYDWIIIPGDKQATRTCWEQIYRANHIEDAKRQVDDYYDSDEEAISKFTEEDYNAMAAEFEENHDCNIADNDQWQEIIRKFG